MLATFTQPACVWINKSMQFQIFFFFLLRRLTRTLTAKERQTVIHGFVGCEVCALIDLRFAPPRLREWQIGCWVRGGGREWGNEGGGGRGEGDGERGRGLQWRDEEKRKEEVASPGLPLSWGPGMLATESHLNQFPEIFSYERFVL